MAYGDLPYPTPGLMQQPDQGLDPESLVGFLTDPSLMQRPAGREVFPKPEPKEGAVKRMIRMIAIAHLQKQMAAAPAMQKPNMRPSLLTQPNRPMMGGQNAGAYPRVFPKA